MFDGSPVKSVLSMLEDEGIVIPNNIAGTNYPSKVVLEGDTKFYDYKTLDQVNLSCLIDTTYLNETINEILGEEQDVKLTIDDFFPVKNIIKRRASEEGYFYIVDEKEYINTPFVTFGGGINLSIVDTSNLSNDDKLAKDIKLDIYEEVLTKSTTDEGQTVVVKGANVLKKCVPMSLGFAPFDFMTYKDGYLYNEVANLNTLRLRAKSI